MLDLTDITAKDLDGNVMTTSDANGNIIPLSLSVQKTVANAVYSSVSDIDFIQPLQDLSKNGKAEFTVRQLDEIEKVVNRTYTLPFQIAICERISKARDEANTNA